MLTEMKSVFFSVATQLAAHEARQGHGKLAQELRELIDAAKGTQSASSLSECMCLRMNRPATRRTGSGGWPSPGA